MLEDHFHQLIKDGGAENLWLAAESGYQYSTGQMAPPQTTDEQKAGLQVPLRKWSQLISLSNKIWFNSVYQVMMTYTENVDGAVVEERDSTLVWNHKNAEEEQGN
jgi:trehalose-6-phosphatase